jgi:hypothetical protein
MGFLEHHPGQLVLGETTSLAVWDAGMVYGSSGRTFETIDKNLIFDNQNNPRMWCACFGHTLWGTDGLSTILNTYFPLIASKNRIYEGDMIGWGVNTIDDFNSIIAKCDELGILFLSPIDFIKNLQFNDYVADDFWKT